MTTTTQIILTVYLCFNCFFAGAAYNDASEKRDLLVVPLMLFFGVIVFAISYTIDFFKFMLDKIDKFTGVSAYFALYFTKKYDNFGIDKLRVANHQFALWKQNNKKSKIFMYHYSKVIAVINERNKYDFSKDTEFVPLAYGLPSLDNK